MELKEKIKNKSLTNILNKKKEYSNKIRKKLNIDINNIIDRIQNGKYSNYKDQIPQNNEYFKFNNRYLFSDVIMRNQNKIINIGELSINSSGDNLTSIRELHRRLISSQEKKNKNSLIKRSNSGLYLGKNVKLFLNKKSNDNKEKKTFTSNLIALEDNKQKNKNIKIMSFKKLYENKGKNLSSIEWTGAQNQTTGKNTQKGKNCLKNNLSGDFNIDFASNRFGFKNYMETVRKKEKIFSDIFSNLPGKIKSKSKIYFMHHKTHNNKKSNDLENDKNNINNVNKIKSMKIKHLAKIKEINFC